MLQKHSIPLSLVGIALIILLLVGYSFGLSNDQSSRPASTEVVLKNEHQEPELVNSPLLSISEATEGGEFVESLKTQIKSTKDLPEIAAVVMKEIIGTDAKILPSVTFLSNDGEYASVGINQSDPAGGYIAFLVKRENKWLVIYKGNGFGECSEIREVRKKYNIKQSFLPCKDEVN